MFTLALALFFVFLIWLINHGIEKLKKGGKAPRVCKVLEKIMYLPTVFLSKKLLIKVFEGSQINILGLAFLNLFMANSTPPMIFGALTSCFFLLLYIGLGFCFAKFALSRSRILNQMSQDEKSKLESILDLKIERDSNLCKLVEALYDGYRLVDKKNRRWYLWIPLIELAYQAGVQFLLVTMTGSSLLQILFITLSFVLYFACFLILRPYIQMWMNLKHILNTSIFAIVQFLSRTKRGRLCLRSHFFILFGGYPLICTSNRLLSQSSKKVRLQEEITFRGKGDSCCEEDFAQSFGWR
jgi:hypothetical protein